MSTRSLNATQDEDNRSSGRGAALLEQLIPRPVTAAELGSIFQRFNKAVSKRALGAEMSHRLGYARSDQVEGTAPNQGNVKGVKTTPMTSAPLH